MDADQWPLGVDVLKQQVKASQLHDEQAGVERKARARARAKARARPLKEDALNCPRCNSTNTKFCYYNNYSLSQPRYFCKTCRRYWTEGGTTRNVPVGGGSRKKNKRYSATTCTLISSLSSSPNYSNSLLMKRKLPLTTFQNPRILEDLNLGSNHHPHQLMKNEHHSTPRGLGPGPGLIPMYSGEGKSVEFDQSPANLSSSICHFFRPPAAGNSSVGLGFSFVGSTTAGTNNIINANNNNNNVINSADHHHYFKLQSLHEGGHGLINHHIGNYYGNAAAARSRTIQEAGVFHETSSTTRLISHHPYELEPYTTSVLLQAAADHRYQGQNNKGRLGESSRYWGGGVSGSCGGSWSGHMWS